MMIIIMVVKWSLWYFSVIESSLHYYYLTIVLLFSLWSFVEVDTPKASSLFEDNFSKLIKLFRNKQNTSMQVKF